MFLRISSSTQAALSLIRTFTLVSLSLRFFLTKFFHPSLRAQFARATRLKKKKPYPIYYLLPISPEPVTLTTMPKLYTIRPSFTTAYSVRNRFSTRNYTIQQPWFHLAFSAFPGQSVRAASRSKGKKKKKKKKKRTATLVDRCQSMDRERILPAKRNADTNDDHRANEISPVIRFPVPPLLLSLCINVPAVYFAILRKSELPHLTPATSKY